MLSRICCRLFGRIVRLSFWPLSQPRLFMKKSPLPGHLGRDSLAGGTGRHRRRRASCPSSRVRRRVGDGHGEGEGARQVAALLLDAVFALAMSLLP